MVSGGATTKVLRSQKSLATKPAGYRKAQDSTLWATRMTIVSSTPQSRTPRTALTEFTKARIPAPRGRRSAALPSTRRSMVPRLVRRTSSSRLAEPTSIFVSVVGSFNGSPRDGALTELFRSGDGGTTWTALDLPTTQEAFATFGLHPGFNGHIHNSVAADPKNPDVVYLGGDRQPAYSAPNPVEPFFPNSIGARGFTARLFRCDASKPSGRQCVNLTDCAPGTTSEDCQNDRIVPAEGGGVSDDSSPHVDSRHMVFDAAAT